MTDRLTSDMSFWLKFVRDSNIDANNSLMLQYSMTLADRFATIDELADIDQKELLQLGIENQIDRIRLIKQAQLLTNKQPILKRRSTVANRVIESWLGDEQATPLNPHSLSKSTTNLSSNLLSRISFNERPTSVVYPFTEPTIGNEIRQRNFGHLNESHEKVFTVDDNGKVRKTFESLSSTSPLEYQGVLKKTPSNSVHGMRTIKSLSDTISLQKKLVPTDRLKRLDSTTSLFQRQTSLLTRKVSTLATKLVNPFLTIKKKIEPPSTTVDLRTSMKRQISIESIGAPTRTVTISPLKRAREDGDEEEPKQQRKVQVLNINQEIRRPTGLFSYDDEPKRVPVQTLGSKRFKLGATTSFLTRSLANHGLIE